jgi:hypothetical protein
MGLWRCIEANKTRRIFMHAWVWNPARKRHLLVNMTVKHWLKWALTNNAMKMHRWTRTQTTNMHRFTHAYRDGYHIHMHENESWCQERVKKYIHVHQDAYMYKSSMLAGKVHMHTTGNTHTKYVRICIFVCESVTHGIHLSLYVLCQSIHNYG